MPADQEQREQSQYPFRINDQYVKDLSFENPNYLMKYSDDGDKQPEVGVGLENNVAKIDDEHYEVTLKVSAKSTIGEKSVFIIELSYAALITVAPNLEQDILEPILMVHCPFLMFPFIREIVASVTSSGGFPPLRLEPIDFASLYMSKKKEIAESKNSIN